MQLIDGIPVFGDPIDEGALSQIKTCARTADHAALMADHHKGYSVPIGGVVAYRNAISPSGVGFDIGCGNKAVLTDASREEIKANIETIMDDIVSTISFGVGRVNNEKVDHEIFDDARWGIRPLSHWKQLARDQLGTVGSGNHYVDIFEDDLGRIWIGCHFGSRGVGHKTATFFLNAAGAKDGMDVEPCVLSMDTNLAWDYLEAMRLAGRYAYAGRDWVCSRVAKILGASILDEVHNNHNFAWYEQHNGESFYVVRKGATPAFPGERGFIGGSMGESAVIIEGIVSPNNAYTLNSTVHGAGRVMSRTAARGKIHRKTGAVISVGAISQDMMNNWLRKANVCLRGGGTDEAPQAYKRLTEVLKHHEGTIKILHTLSPIGVAMAGATEFDPYKD
jgi:tRNA-splicing ligase RtcB (3'-phosphate/5'-hydroxy nucleic acid ligase)